MSNLARICDKSLALLPWDIPLCIPWMAFRRDTASFFFALSYDSYPFVHINFRLSTNNFTTFWRERDFNHLLSENFIQTNSHCLQIYCQNERSDVHLHVKMFSRSRETNPRLIASNNLPANINSPLYVFVKERVTTIILKEEGWHWKETFLCAWKRANFDAKFKIDTEATFSTTIQFFHCLH